MMAQLNMNEYSSECLAPQSKKKLSRRKRFAFIYFLFYSRARECWIPE